MPSVFDRTQLSVDRDPLQQMVSDIPNTPDFNPLDIVENLLNMIFDPFCNLPIIREIRMLFGWDGHVGTAAVDAIKQVAGGIQMVWDFITGLLGNPIDGIVGVFRFLQEAVDWFWNLLTGGLGEAGKTIAHLLEAANNWILDIPIIGDVIKWIEDAVGDVIRAITRGLGWTLDHLVQWGHDLWHDAGKVIGNIWNVTVEIAGGVVHKLGDFFGLIADGLAGAIFEPVGKFFTGLWTSIRKLFEQNKKSYEYAVAPRVFGAWQADLTDDVSFAMSLIDAKTRPQPGQMVLIPLTAHKNRSDIDSVKVGMYGIPGKCLMALYRVQREDAAQPDAYGKTAKAGDATLFLNLGDVTDILRRTTAELKIVKFADAGLQDTISVKSGELFYLAVVQSGVTVDMATWSAVSPISTGLQPKALSMARKGSFAQVVERDSFTDADVVVTGAGVGQYWAAMGKAVGQLDTGPDNARTFIDDFNRPVTGVDAVGPDWVTRAGFQLPGQALTKPDIVTKLNIAERDFALATRGYLLAHVERLGTLNQQLQASLWWQPNATTQMTVSMNLALHGDGAGNFVYAEVTYDYPNRRWYTRIFTHDPSQMFPSRVERGLNNAGTAAGPFYLTFSQYPKIKDQFRFVTTFENTYEVRFHDGTDWRIASKWVDTNDAFKVTESHTEFGIASDFKVGLSDPVSFSSVIDDVTAKDLRSEDIGPRHESRYVL